MPRKLSPCGTPAAAKRHRRNDEPLCDECRAAEQGEKNGRAERKRDASAEQVREAVTAAPEIDTVDPLAEALDNLRIVRAVLQDGETPANTIAQLTRRRDELVDRVKRFQEAETPVEVSVIDELTSRRSERRSAASG